ncbi:hypothetical protein MSAN_00112300 [Mycena sanguinolenta]|uniref:Uncharacterized protein n=1 Tax=Mycena sanguinolenta TaxID=230812 RepID=A0A8H7DJX7_9AGAR|nr:hypothetical protein MSAN_00112300 [Mycena sanguinolenta]
MDNDSTASGSTSVPLSCSTGSLITISNPIPATIPRPFYFVPQYNYHGLPFALLPPDIQSFLTSYGLDNPAVYDTAAVASVREWLTDNFMQKADRQCELIAYNNVKYNILRTVHPPEYPLLTELVTEFWNEVLPQLREHLAAYLVKADALVWADVAAREGGPDALSVEDVLRYRSLQIQPVVDLITDRMVDLYAWSAEMWMRGWRSDGYTTYQIQPPVADEEVPFVGEKEEAEVEEKEEAAPSVPCRVDTPSPTIGSPTAHSSPVEPRTPPCEAFTPESSGSSPRSPRRVASPPSPSSPTRARGSSRMQWLATAPTKHPKLGVKCSSPGPQRTR